MVKRYQKLMLVLFKCADLVVTALAWLAAYYLRFLGGQMGLTPHHLPPFADFLAPMALSLVLCLLVFSRLRIYRPVHAKSLPAELADVWRAVFIAWGLAYVIASLMREVQFSRLMMIAVLTSWLILGSLNRLLMRAVLRWMRSRGWNQQTAVIVGTGRLAQKLYYTLRRHLWTGIDPHYFIGESSELGRLCEKDVLGPTEQIDRIISDRPVEIAFVALSSQSQEQVGDVLDKLAMLNIDVRMVPDLLAFNFLKHEVMQFDEIPIVALTHSPQHGWSLLLKRVLDIAVSVMAIVILALPMLLIALLVKLTGRGPVFYRQIRASLGGEPFRIIKFRTMKHDRLAESDASPTEPEDPRVTRIGRLLRRTSLDELPQLCNVLLGHMSLVGPRPERPELVEQFRREVPRYMLRHQVRAGMTGWAQVHGLRGQSSLRKRIQYDLYYIGNWTFGLDLRILLMTPFKGLTHPNAY